MKKKIVIISRTMFPLNAPRSSRSTELMKEFARQGYDVTIYAVLGKFDYKEFEKKYKVKVKNLGPTIFAKLNSDGEEKYSFFHRILRKLLKRTLEFPDIELAFRTNSILKKEKDIDLLVTVAVPFPIHWGTAYRKMKSPENFPKVWVADCGDPYMGNKLHKRPFYFKYVEQWFCKKVDFISIPIEGAKNAYYPEFQDKIKVIPQGFDFSNVPNIITEPENKVTTFIYAGVFYSRVRDPRPFLDYLVSEKDKSFLFKVYTKSKDIVKPYKDLLGEKLEIKDYIPREELLKEMVKADFLVNFENNTEVQSPSKLIDYALTKRPILSMNTNKELDKKLISEFLESNYTGSMKIDNIQQYNIKNVAQDFLKLFK